jgi:hypothetical protein
MAGHVHRLVCASKTQSLSIRVTPRRISSTDKENTMTLLYFHAKLRELHCSALEFFEVAYITEVKKWPPSLADDYAQYLMHSIIPPYAIAYLKKLQEREGDSCLQLTLPLERIP